jgi:aminoglycoside 3-N-acetyltransferase
MVIVVHSSLAGLGRVRGGANAVVESLIKAVGPDGTVVVPTFTPDIADPYPDAVGPPDPHTEEVRESVPVFDPATTPSRMGAIAEALRGMPGAVRGDHPQVSLAAYGPCASEIVSPQPYGFAVGPASPFDRLHDLGAHILLIGVGHDRNTFLHFAESFATNRRRKLRRFPMLLKGERVWVETPDVGDDYDGYFPLVGKEFEARAGIAPTRVARADCRLIPCRDLVRYATGRLDELLATD